LLSWRFPVTTSAGKAQNCRNETVLLSTVVIQPSRFVPSPAPESPSQFSRLARKFCAASESPHSLRASVNQLPSPACSKMPRSTRMQPSAVTGTPLPLYVAMAIGETHLAVLSRHFSDIYIYIYIYSYIYIYI